jgi:hypothetical protein
VWSNRIEVRGDDVIFAECSEEHGGHQIGGGSGVSSVSIGPQPSVKVFESFERLIVVGPAGLEYVSGVL